MKKVAVVHTERCSGCQLCQLVCSFFQSSAKRFQPDLAYIKVHRVDNSNRFQVALDTDCVHCGACVTYCQYGVLEKQAGGLK